MAKKAKTTGKISSGNRSKIRTAREERRQLKFAKKREEGKAYEYVANPHKKGTYAYVVEQNERAAKNTGEKLPTAKLTSIFAKLDNQLAKQKENMKNNERKSSKKDK